MQVGDDGRVYYSGPDAIAAHKAAVELSSVRLGKARIKVYDEKGKLHVSHYEWGEKLRRTP